jgi:hypothetical protein
MGNEETGNSSSVGSGKWKNCRVCCEPIKAQAIKCTKCGSYQDWTRHLVRWSALFVSLFALAPLWSISNSVSKLAFSDKVAQIEAAITSCSHKEVRVAFENTGELSGIVTSVDFAIKKGDEVRPPDGEMRPTGNGGDILVLPDKPPVMLSYRAFIDGEPTNIIPEADTAGKCSYLLDIRWTDFAGSKKQLTRECRCR